MPEATLRNETSDSTSTESDSEPDSDSDSELTRDDIFHVLQCRRRRLVLKYLQEYDGDEPARMGDIAEHIAALEHDTTIDALRSQQRQRVYIALYQSHLPKMDKAGVLEYNQSRGYVETTSLASRFDPYLDNEPSLLHDEEAEAHTPTDTSVQRTDDTDRTSADVDVSWHKRYLYAAGGSLFLASALSSGLVSAQLPSQVGMGILVSALFTLLAVSHWATESSWSDLGWTKPDVDNWNE
ncbi:MULTISPECIES: DUF7344 domain-containing protein [Haloarcula]|uniref:DUF7344 domain-containing protein n=1 Tax=Haloarcula pellucida TaxID=1427151 RepID=A0A830GK13_9EURY|nr:MULTISPECIES: hypothetical protein [Halomicroarcula]MBX0349739.1 hypothetical protein [Halomicroarcula pellucida]MDS0279887.1 hypothetical protein [Halomicroarcula sp. S1AR25-4]GGN94071.1 hypothetical protein GCM10009030_20070 [Halomicroarcula pellucida]